MKKTTNAWDENSHDDEKEGKKLTPDVSSLIVRIIEDESNLLHKTLGISNTNSKRLQNLIYDQLKADSEAGVSRSNTSTMMVEISKHCTHANELAFACFALGKITSEHGKEDKDHKGGARMGAIGINKDTGEVRHFGSSDDEDVPDFIKDILRDILKGTKGKKKDKDDE